MTSQSNGSDSSKSSHIKRGPLEWMTQNSVAANLLMLVLVVGGLIIGSRVKREVFPEFDLDAVIVNIAYPGASPAEVEQGVVLAVEEEVRGLDGVKEVESVANEGFATIKVELLTGVDSNIALGDVKSAIDRITSFPEDIERPVVSLATMRRQVISLVIYGEQTERVLRGLAEKARDELLDDERISVTELAAVRPYEISIEVGQETLRAYNLTLDQIAAVVRAASVEIPGGAVKTRGGEVLLRTMERRLHGIEYEDITVLARPDGTRVRLGDIATVRDSFKETDQETYFNGAPAAMVDIYRVGDENPVDVAAAAFEYVDRLGAELPEGVSVAIWNDQAEMYRDRMSLLMRNAYIGLVLVLLILGLFLDIRLAFWVTLGIPISFLGSLLFLPPWGVSINMISMFAFIITLGIVVDDAIVVGESVYTKRKEGLGLLDSAIVGVREVSTPVIFSILTTVAAFSPLLFVPGIMGKFFRNIPTVVIAVLTVSLIESLLVLPAHLAHSGKEKNDGWLGKLAARQRRFSEKVERFIENVFQPLVKAAVRRRHLTMAIGTMILLTAIGYVAGGRIGITFMPKIDSDRISATVELPFGTPVEDTKAIAQHLTESARRALDENDPGASRGILTQVATQSVGRHGGDAPTGSHMAQVTTYLLPSDQRDIKGSEFALAWRKAAGEIAGVETLTFNHSTGPGSDAPISVELSHRHLATLEAAATKLAAELSTYAGAVDINDGFALGKEQLDFTLRPEARSLGVTENDLARQVRASFFGAEAGRQQRGREELRTYVRLPREQRASEYDVERLLLRTPNGGEVPLGRAAAVSRGRSYTEIKRIDGKRVINVTADVLPNANANQIMGAITKAARPGLLAEFPGLTWSKGGMQKDQQESFSALGIGLLLALIAIYGLLAVPFKSYVQPVVIMVAIPFGLVGALFGHVLLGFDLSLISMMGVVALSGVVVNDSLVLIVAVNGYRQQGLSAVDAVIQGAKRRFRPILLTSLTTFFGLMPMILEPSQQARFLVPMAISLGFGVLFATVICLLLVPAAYMTVEDIGGVLRRAWGAVTDAPEPSTANE